MKEIGLLNRELSRYISQQGHQDLLMVVDAGFAIPKDLDVVDLALSINVPTVPQVLAVLKDYYSVEKMVISHETKNISPTLFDKIRNSFGVNMEVELVEHHILKVKSKEVKLVIRTGDFTAYGNVILVSGAGDRWYLEKNE
ncbi:MAG: D-ribose pyranase [Flammeovirgaceae bacterium TMED32]|nr:MAG: D-ribose pyranase [Flammeovirgaceae bacterium TMED32]